MDFCFSLILLQVNVHFREKIYSSVDLVTSFHENTFQMLNGIHSPYMRIMLFLDMLAFYSSFHLNTEKDASNCSLTCFKKKTTVYWKR